MKLHRWQLKGHHTSATAAALVTDSDLPREPSQAVTGPTREPAVQYGCPEHSTTHLCVQNDGVKAQWQDPLLLSLPAIAGQVRRPLRAVAP
jgi:hypothetical protein